MIKNFLFDCGNVLLAWDREHLLDVFIGDDKADRELILNTLFKEWHLQDEGMPSKDFFEMIKKMVPERFHRGVYNLIYHWKEEMWPIEGMEEFVIELKKKGYKVILVSNMPETFTYDHDDISVLKYFDGLVFSYAVKCAKPNKEIFEYALNKYDMKKEECLFIDDMIENVKGAENAGIKGYLFNTKNPKEFIDYVNTNIIQK